MRCVPGLQRQVGLPLGIGKLGLIDVPVLGQIGSAADSARDAVADGNHSAHAGLQEYDQQEHAGRKHNDFRVASDETKNGPGDFLRNGRRFFRRVPYVLRAGGEQVVNLTFGETVNKGNCDVPKE